MCFQKVHNAGVNSVCFLSDIGSKKYHKKFIVTACGERSFLFPKLMCGKTENKETKNMEIEDQKEEDEESSESEDEEEMNDSCIF